MSVVHHQANGQPESANKVILKELNKNLDDANGIRVKLLPKILWSYHTTMHSTTKETPFSMLYEVDVMLPMEIDTPSWRQSQFNEKENYKKLKCVVDLVDELREVANFREFAAKHGVARR
ncbi:hypothetical protein KIW84_061465 [Lathyrus oleraceus]|uniref:Uncharacterized protein n=1 Tax=Pisum sativum TaxID=3888 RepID=A0A9D5A6W0_PEA|nr:hypothetical protein KIW84_061465 [Pisum sativum]